jgi:hypothetical protein
VNHHRKTEITLWVLDKLEIRHHLDQALNSWYFNLRKNGGLRLTQVGRQCFEKAGVQCWRLDIDPRGIDKRILLELDRKLEWPYYIDFRKKSLIFYSSREAMMATLYGDLRAWLCGIDQVDQ